MSNDCMYTSEEMAGLIDQTLLKPYATKQDMDAFCK